MKHITTASFLRPAGGVGASRHPYRTHFAERHFPLVSNHPLSTLPLEYPLYHSPAVPVPISEPKFHSLHDHWGMSIPSVSYNSNLSLEESASDFADGERPYAIPHADQAHLHITNVITPDSPSAPSPSGLLYMPNPTTGGPEGFPKPTNTLPNSTGGPGQTQIQATVYPLSASMTFHGIGDAHATPQVPVPFFSSATGNARTVHTCQCMIDGSPCNTEVSGSIRSVRDHLKRVHVLRCTGKDLIECPWAGCENTLQRESIPRHIVSCHLRVKVSCDECGLSLSRPDVRFSHARACRARRPTQIASGPGSDLSYIHAHGAYV